jgi:hypothetical protein
MTSELRNGTMSAFFQAGNISYKCIILTVIELHTKFQIFMELSRSVSISSLSYVVILPSANDYLNRLCIFFSEKRLIHNISGPYIKWFQCRVAAILVFLLMTI